MIDYSLYIACIPRKLFHSFICLLLLTFCFTPSSAFAQTCIGATPSGESAYIDNLSQGGGGTNSAGLAAATPDDCCFYRAENHDCEGNDNVLGIPIVSEEQNFYISGTMCLVQTIIAQSMFKIYCGILSNWGNVLAATVTLYFVLYFIAMLFRIKQTTLRDGIMHFIKGIIVISIVQNPYFVFNFMYRGFLLFMDGVSVQLACTINNEATCTAAEIALLKTEGGGVFSNIDIMFTSTIGVESSVAYVAAFVIVVIILIMTGVGIPLAIALLSSYYAILKTFIWLLMSYITAFIAIIFLLMFAPIFFTCFLFSATRPFFTQWMANLISYCFQPILIVTFIFMIGESARIGALFGQINVLARAAGALPMCERNPLATTQYAIEDQYGLYDVDGAFHAMKIFYPWMDDPPFCQNGVGSLRPCPYYIENGPTAGGACNNSTTDPCYSYGKDEGSGNSIKFDGIVDGVNSVTALAQIDGDPTTGLIGPGTRVGKRLPPPPVTGGWDGLERVECGVFIMPSPISGYWDFSMPLPKFRNPRRRHPVPAHFFGVNQPAPLVADYAAGPGAAGDVNAQYYYAVSFIVAFKVLVALIIVWFIVSSTMEAFLAKVPEFSRRLIQFESQMGSAVITGQSPTFAEVTKDSSGPGAAGDVKGNYQFAGSSERMGGRRTASVYTTGGAIMGGASAMGKIANLTLGAIPGVSDIYGAAKSSVANQALMQQQRGRNFLKGGGVIGHVYRNNKRLNQADTIRRTGINNSNLKRAEFSAYDNPFANSSMRKDKNYSSDLDPSGGGGDRKNTRFAKEVSTATSSLKTSLGFGSAAALSSDTALRDLKISTTNLDPSGGGSLNDPFSRNKSSREDVDLSGNKKVLKTTTAYLPKDKKDVTLNSLADTLKVSGATGLGNFVKATVTAKAARALNDSKIDTTGKSEIPGNTQKRDSARKILKSAKRIGEAHKKNSSSYIVQPKADISLLGMGATFTKSILSNEGFEKSIKNAVKSGLNRAERTAKTSGNLAALERIQLTKAKISTEADKFKASQAAAQQKSQGKPLSKEDQKLAKQLVREDAIHKSQAASNLALQERRALAEEADKYKGLIKDSRSLYVKDLLKEAQKNGMSSKEAMQMAAATQQAIDKGEAKNFATKNPTSSPATEPLTKTERDFRKQQFKALKDATASTRISKNIHDGILIESRREQKDIINNAERDGKTIDETKQLLEQLADEKRFINAGRNSTERKQRKTEVEKLRNARLNNLEGPVKSLASIKEDFEKNTPEGKKLVAKEDKIKYRDLLEDSRSFYEKDLIKNAQQSGVPAKEAEKMAKATRKTLEDGAEKNRGNISKAAIATGETVLKGADGITSVIDAKNRRKEFKGLKDGMSMNRDERSKVNTSRREGNSLEDTRKAINKERNERSNEKREEHKKKGYERDFKEQVRAATVDFDRNMAELRLAESGALRQEADKLNKGRSNDEKLNVGGISELAAQQKALLDQGLSREEIIDAMANTRLDILKDYDNNKDAMAEAKEKRDNTYNDYMDAKDEFSDIGKTPEQIKEEKEQKEKDNSARDPNAEFKATGFDEALEAANARDEKERKLAIEKALAENAKADAEEKERQRKEQDEKDSDI